MDNAYQFKINEYKNTNNICHDTDNAPNNVSNKNGLVLNEIGHVPNGIGRGDPTLGQIVGFFKYGVSKHINQIRKTPGIKLWQRNYYEHSIRNENEYNRISEYIKNNPMKWDMDSFFPDI